MKDKKLKKIAKSSHILPVIYDVEQGEEMIGRYMTESEATDFLRNCSKEEQQLYWQLYLDDIVVKIETNRLLYSLANTLEEFYKETLIKIKRLLNV